MEEAEERLDSLDIFDSSNTGKCSADAAEFLDFEWLLLARTSADPAKSCIIARCLAEAVDFWLSLLDSPTEETSLVLDSPAFFVYEVPGRLRWPARELVTRLVRAAS